ncbi:MAG TPA: hypothetical protein VF039_09835 [Longimicrobiales bacterium]
MSHVDEGILHALLDGALAAAAPAEAERVELHLAACADCRARLNEAARLRDEAGALLASAQPRSAAMPPFDEIRARARALAAGDDALAAPAHRRRAAFLATPFNGFAWAATVVLAVGLGWLLHDTVAEPERAQRIGMADESFEEGDVATAPEPADPPTDVDMQSVGSTPSGRPVEADFGAGPEAARPLAAAPEERVAAGVPSAPPPPPSMQVQSDAVQAYDVVEQAESGAASGAGVADAVAAAPAPVAPTLSSRADGWSATSAERATQLVGELVRIDGALLVDVATRATAAGVEVRSVQMTDRGELLTLVQRSLETDRRMQAGREEATRLEARARRDAPAAAAEAQAEAPSLESSQPTVSVQIGDRVVTISGAVTRARLDEIADGLR